MFFTIENDSDGIRTLIFDRQDIDSNVLSAEVLFELSDLMSDAEQSSDVKGIIITSAKKGQFIAGADIKEISKFTSAQEAQEGAAKMQQLFNKIANIKKPTVAAINGACLGGGLELALACRWRVVTDASKTVLALPEIKLGLIPGAGGTQRLPRLIGIQAALDMILTGKNIRPAKAGKLGLADAVVHPNQLQKIAKEFALNSKRRKNKGGSLMKSALEGNTLGRSIMQMKAREAVDKNTKGFYPAPYKALDAVFKGIDRKIEKGLETEARLFGELATTKESASLIHLFHATTHIKKHEYKSAGKEHFRDQKTNLVGVIGAGFMGAGIANVCADKGIRVRMSDPSKDSLGRALQSARSYFAKKVKRRHIKKFEAGIKVAHISPELTPIGMETCDIVVEAVFEDLSLKQKILSEFEGRTSKDWIFATNTSAIPIAKIAEKSAMPERILGMHFFSPVEKMPLLEIIITDKTAPWATARAIELGQTLGKQVIVVKDGPGFYTTRALSFYLNEAALILSENARIDEVDRALTDFGFPVGPITLIDEVGIDVGAHVLETMQSAFASRVDVPQGVKAVLETGRLGRKNNKGFYLYENGKKQNPDDAVYDVLKKYRVSDKGVPPDEIVDRCLLIFVNESVRCLEEGILPDAFAGDVGAVFGLGFPPFWGGPFRYIDHIGAGTLVERLNALYDRYGERFKPADLLNEHAQSKKLFFPDEKQH